MATDHTIIIPKPGETPETTFNHYVNETMIVMIVLGNDAKAQDIQTKANKIAETTYYNKERKVIWIKDRELLKNILNGFLQNSSFNNISLDQIAALGINYKNNLREVISLTENITTIRVNQAFIKAGKTN
jgi:hypothetical protein